MGPMEEPGRRESLGVRTSTLVMKVSSARTRPAATTALLTELPTLMEPIFPAANVSSPPPRTPSAPKFVPARSRAIADLDRAEIGCGEVGAVDAVADVEGFDV